MPNKELPWAGSAIGALMSLMPLGMGLYIILIALNFIPTADENFSAPRSIVAGAGFVFFVAGLLMLMGLVFSAEELRLPVMLWIQFLLILAVMTVFSGLFLWTGFGPGERTFQTSTSIGPVSTHGQGNEGVGRIVFGGVGLLSSLGTLWYAIVQTNNLFRGQFKSIFERKNSGRDSPD